MAFLIRPTLQAVQSHLLASGWFRDVRVGEPKSPPDELTAALWMDSASVVALTLSDTIELHVVMIRLYENVLTEPTEGIEFLLDQALAQIEKDLFGDYDLGATIRNIDIGGKHGTSYQSVLGYIEIGDKNFRVADITLPLEVDGSATLVA